MSPTTPPFLHRVRGAHTRAALASWLLLAVGIAVSIVGAATWRAQASRQESQSFAAEAAGVGSTATASLHRIEDLMIAERTEISSNPNLTNRQLQTWYDRMEIAPRFAGTLGFGFIAFVSHKRLPAFLAAARRDPIPGTAPLTVIWPSRERSYYCLSQLGVAGALEQSLSSIDACAIPGGDGLAATRDSGRPASLTLGTGIVSITLPVYRGGVVPATVAERRARMLGWATGMFDMNVILGAAAAAHHALQLDVVRQDLRQAGSVGPSWTEARLSAGSAQAVEITKVGSTVGGRVLRLPYSVDADGHWTVTVSRGAQSGPFSPGEQGLMVLAGGLLMSVLLFVLVRTLGQGRARALRIVHEKTEQLRHQALHDALTGLPNRALIMDRAVQMLARARRSGSAPSAIFIDLDGFKAINDTYGHPAGDELLRLVAIRISDLLRASDTVGRLGGDEFVVLIEADGSADGAELVAERLLAALTMPFRIHAPEQVVVSMTVTIGIATGDRPAAEDLLRDADIALYEAKTGGKNSYAVFAPHMHVAVHDRLALEMDLRRALERDEFALVYQPTFDLATSSVTGVEALLRWRHPERGMVQPGDFIPIAETTGMIVAMGEWVLHAACRQGAAWHAQGYRLSVSVNVSGRQLDDPDLPIAVGRALSSSGLDASSLVLEITETSLMKDAEASARSLTALKRLGIRIAVDDFGTGYSSLAYLQQFPVDTLKIDRRFVAGVARSSESRALVHTLVQLARALNLHTLAEGIEDSDQLARLREEGCDSGQGFLLARPMEPEAFERFVSELARDDDLGGVVA